MKMPGKDKVDLRRCVELLTEMLENESQGLYLILNFTIKFINFCASFAQKKLKLYVCILSMVSYFVLSRHGVLLISGTRWQISNEVF